MKVQFKRFAEDVRGTAMIEYLVAASLISTVLIVLANRIWIADFVTRWAIFTGIVS